jgi:hypothetical protein
MISIPKIWTRYFPCSHRSTHFSLNMDKQALLEYVGYNHYSSNDFGHMMLDFQQKPPDVIWVNFPAKKGQRKFIRRFDEKGFKIREIRQQEDIRPF